ncbi:MAG: hypothetical protein COB42_00130 [Sulfurimonas sp.]|nr:MAG: hypothetical protein COB42_00130 [Sulfurimonas sp.]
MKKLKFFFFLFLSFSTLNAASSQDDVKVAIIGKLSNFITWKSPSNNQNFIITVVGDKAFKKHLYTKYNEKNINSKKVLVLYVDSIDDLRPSDILYTGKLSQTEQYKFINYSKKNSILSISEAYGFAQRGGIIQLYFVSQNLKFKINHKASIQSNLKINAALLSIATIVKGK